MEYEQIDVELIRPLVCGTCGEPVKYSMNDRLVRTRRYVNGTWYCKPECVPR